MPSFQSHPDLVLDRLKLPIRIAVRALSVLMVFVILMGVADVVYVLYQKLSTPPYFMLEISDLLATFGAFMAVLIAIEIYVNIAVYLQENVIHVKIVMATALMAVARKIIIIDMKVVEPSQLYGLAAVTLATGLAYWLAVVLPNPRHTPVADLLESGRPDQPSREECSKSSVLGITHPVAKTEPTGECPDEGTGKTSTHPDKD